MTSAPTMKNLVAGVLLALLGAGTLWATAGFPRGVAAAADAALLPRTLGVGLIVIGVLVLLMALRSLRTGAASADDAEGLPIDMPVDIPDELLQHEDTDGPPEKRLVALLSLTLVAYAWAAFRIGFVVSTFAVIVVSALLLGRSRHTRAIVGLVAFAIAVAAGVYVGFFELLSVRPPRTPLP